MASRHPPTPSVRPRCPAAASRVTAAPVRSAPAQRAGRPGPAPPAAARPGLPGGGPAPRTRASHTGEAARGARAQWRQSGARSPQGLHFPEATATRAHAPSVSEAAGASERGASRSMATAAKATPGPRRPPRAWFGGAGAGRSRTRLWRSFISSGCGACRRRRRECERLPGRGLTPAGVPPRLSPRLSFKPVISGADHYWKEN